ncbi:hypothetical protein PRIPAC_73272 [Pristionchus pacificus]|uniref:Membrane transporter n=1 Tax=Pristionchus pacificus TaxID=54126 RepID=A0A2A6BF02_PRIPA|nr:hypothetical protein PRIPAC_73272 [Pristionchus pacificus]|eukprot:PDM64485.1 membrane transporter [Pristionchus pacificus]
MITRLDVLIIGFWQVLLISNVQLLMPIFLNYMPNQKCDGTIPLEAFCYDIVGRCYKCLERCGIDENVCLNNETCFHDIRRNFAFKSAANEYGQYCNPRIRAWIICFFNFLIRRTHSKRSFSLEFKLFRVETIQFVGVLLGTVLFGLLSERHGRRRILLIALAFGLPALLLSGEVKHVVWFYLFRFLVGLSNGAGLLVGWSYVSELISAKNRFLLRIASSWPVARIIMTLVCFATGEWRMATRMLVLLTLPLFPVLFFVLPESHVWLAAKGRRDEYDYAMTKLNVLAGCVYVRKSDHHFASKSVRMGLRNGLMQIFSRYTLGKRMIMLFSFWFGTYYVRYILDLNSDSMFKDRFFAGQFILCGVLVGTTILIGIANFILPGISRKIVHLVAQAGVILFAMILMILHINGHKGSTLFMWFWIAALFSIELCSEVCFLTANELMPIESRGAAFHASSIVARIGTVASTFTHYEPVLYVIVILVSITNWLVSYFYLEDGKGTRDEVARERTPAKSEKAQTSDKGVINNQERSAETNENSNNGQPTTESSTTEKDDLGFSDLIFWTTSASNPSYDAAVVKATRLDGEGNGKIDDSELAVCNSLDGSCGIFRKIAIDADEEGTEVKQADLIVNAVQGETIRAHGEASEDEEEEDLTVIRF